MANMEGSERYYIKGFSTTTMEDGDTRGGRTSSATASSKEATTAKTSTSSRNAEVRIRSSQTAVDGKSGGAIHSTT